MSIDPAQHEPHMRRALDLARRGRGRVEPNPMVGCVLVRDGRVIGEGYHHRFGGPHAEAQALRDARRRGEDVAGCDVYVTLEPCAHQGKTPPCARALVEAKVGRVFAAMQDPFERVSGRGFNLLRQAGIEVHVGLLGERAQRLCAPFIKRVTTGRPWVILKWAQTLDGRIATRSGHSQWISGPAARAMVHRLRARVDAVMVGAGTQRADDPQLTARNVPIRRQARRVVVDPSLSISDSAALLREPAGLTLAISRENVPPRAQRIAQLRARGVEVIELPGPAGAIALSPLLEHLSKAHEATNVLVEGGGGLAGALLSQGLVDELLVFVAPKLAGDALAVAPVRDLLPETMDQATRLTLAAARRLPDGDLALRYRVGSAEASPR